jgi:uncharacterized membrane protein YoaK (UPF0700 family)
MTPRLSGEHALPLALSFAAGYVEAICFTGLFHTFTTFITGTLMILIIELVNGEAGYINKAIIFVSFFAFTLLWIYLIKTWSWRPGLRKPAALLLEAILIAVFMALGTVLEPLKAADTLNTLIVSVAAVLAMSLHSTIFFVLLKNLAPTHFMTGNLTNFSVGVVDLLRGTKLSEDRDDDWLKDAKFRVWHFPAVISSFVAGVTLGSAGFLSAGFVVLIVPAAVLAIAAFLSLRIEAGSATV